MAVATDLTVVEEREAPTNSEGKERKTPVYYSPSKAREICDRISEGESLVSIVAGPYMPALTTVYHWLQDHPEFRSAFALARELSAYSLEEEAIAAVRRVNLDPVFQTQVGVRAAEVLANQLRWSAAKRNANAFADNQKASLVVPIQINTSLDLGQPGAERDKSDPSAVYTIKAQLPTPEAIEKSPAEVMLEPTIGLTAGTRPNRSRKTSFNTQGRKKGTFTLSAAQKAKLAEGRAKYWERKRAEKEKKDAEAGTG